ncbi:HlyC/CorC family transporter [Shewanella oneidensis MR-1]|uniref:Transporter-like protein HCC family n=1 Tax=Shewanella oneidensis (strain ATCC 700550 / JCM 31522 / CIP 106686 / LMG 19005 / NCIMB 14063 / MR-1) TaxID=211586 RepID=Q8EDE1_SHEON|nr:hemolysin family protein [Shewanella oneidensis]AAN55834.1 transporter-like protein HCC family [Shewanella oneidensis MR-1]MDX5995526.1 hemolysin family protein [Shewanella oneidensis]QKG97299.1 HlyC/CorC family transporter [Shewanella oneidensis MR-1]
MEIFILIGLIVLNGLFAMSEIAIVTARKSRLTALAHAGSSTAKAALKLAEDPTQFLSTVQIGITSIGILNGIFGESILAEPLSLWLQTFGLSPDVTNIFSTVLVVIIVTYVSIVIGELVPKRIGQVSAESIACIMAKPMVFLAIATKPFVWMLSGSTHALMRLMGFSHRLDDNVTQEDIQAMLQEGSSAGVIEHNEHAMVKNVFRLDERTISSLMVPRSDIVFLDLNLPLDANLRTVMQSPHSRFPVCRNNVDDMVGIISAKQLLSESIAGERLELVDLVKNCNFVPNSLSGMELLEHFRTTGSQMVFVVDEYGDLKGLVTLQDMMDALTGEFFQEDVNDQMVIKREDGSLLLDGLIPIFDLKDALGIKQLPNEEDGRYQTLNGFLMYELGKIPQTTDIVEVAGWRLEIMDMDGKRVDKVLAQKLPDAEDSEESIFVDL